MVQNEFLKFDIDLVGGNLFFKIHARNNNVLFEKRFELMEDSQLDKLFDIIEIFLEQVKYNRNDYKSGDVSDSYMINKYGENFLSLIKDIIFDDYEYFSVSIFIPDKNNELEPLVIVPINDKVFILKGKLIISLILNDLLISSF